MTRCKEKPEKRALCPVEGFDAAGGHRAPVAVRYGQMQPSLRRKRLKTGRFPARSLLDLTAFASYHCAIINRGRP